MDQPTAQQSAAENKLRAEAKKKNSRSESRTAIILAILLAAMTAIVVWAERDVELPEYHRKVM